MALINPSTTVPEIVATTLRNRTGKLADNVTKNNALLYRLKSRGRVKPVSGGRTIIQELNYQENGTLSLIEGFRVTCNQWKFFFLQLSDLFAHNCTLQGEPFP